MLKFLSGSVTQSAADTFTQAEIATGLANASLGYRIRGIIWGFPTPVEVDAQYIIQLTRRSATATAALSDRTLIAQRTRTIKITTSGSWLIDGDDRDWYSKDLELLIVEDPIFIACASATTSAANTGRVRIYYEEVRLSETAKLAALTESLNA